MRSQITQEVVIPFTTPAHAEGFIDSQDKLLWPLRRVVISRGCLPFLATAMSMTDVFATCLVIGMDIKATAVVDRQRQLMKPRVCRNLTSRIQRREFLAIPLP